MENNSLIPIKTTLPALVKKTDIQLGLMKKILDLSIYSDLPKLIPYRKGDKWGFCDRNKKIVVECVYDWARPFSEG